MLAVQVLVQAVVVAGPYCKSSGVGRCWPAMWRRCREIGMVGRIAHVYAHGFVPGVGHADQAQVAGVARSRATMSGKG